MEKPAIVTHPVDPLIETRWSPRAFEPAALDDHTLPSLLEAARWASSCFNEQPWRFIVASRTDQTQFTALLNCLAAGNQSWAKNAGALILTIAKLSFDRNDKPNRHAWHDVGLAVGNLVLQATSLGLHAHQMAGFSADKARDVYAIPRGFDPVAVVAIGKIGDPKTLDDELQRREMEPRSRLPLDQVAFAGRFGSPAKLA